MKKILLNVILALGLTLPVYAVPGVALAACPSANSPQGQALQGIDQSGCNDSGVVKVINAIVQILSLVIGVVAIIMIMVSGFKYITSGGEQQRVANAKSTLIYAMIGIAIAAVAQLLVHFVLNQANKVGS